MKTITVNVQEQVEVEFRAQASRKYGKKKGYLGRAITEAMLDWVKKSDSDIEIEASKLLETGIKMKKWKFERGELYER